jgi:predicted ester cyclase
MSEDNKALFRRFYEEIYDGRNLDATDDFIASDNYVEHLRMPPGVPPGLEGIKALQKAYLAAFPDLTLTITWMVAEDDMVVAHYTATGTHQGELAGIPPTGRQIEITGMDAVRIAAGKIVEHWGNMDEVAMMAQLGALPG